jgi:hypothetical protein
MAGALPAIATPAWPGPDRLVLQPWLGGDARSTRPGIGRVSRGRRAQVIRAVFCRGAASRSASRLEDAPASVGAATVLPHRRALGLSGPWPGWEQRPTHRAEVHQATETATRSGARRASSDPTRRRRTGRALRRPAIGQRAVSPRFPKPPLPRHADSAGTSVNPCDLDLSRRALRRLGRRGLRRFAQASNAGPPGLARAAFGRRKVDVPGPVRSPPTRADPPSGAQLIRDRHRPGDRRAYDRSQHPSRALY